MAVTYAELVDHLNIVIGENHDGRLNEQQIINQAGNFLIGLHPWRCQSRPSALLDLIADQPWVDIPNDFGNGEILGITQNGTLNFDVQLTTLQEIDRFGGTSIPSPSRYFVALSYPTQNNTVEPLAAPRLEINPTPSATESGAFRFSYRAGWVPLSPRGSHVSNIPPWMDLALTQCVRAFGSYYDTNDNTLIEKFVVSAEIERIRAADARQQRNVGRARGGILQGTGPDYSTNWNWSHTGVS